MKIKILIVEDDLIIAETVRNDLIIEGYDVAQICFSGEEAVVSISKNPPDIILMDIILAGKMDGIETTELIRKNYRIPIIYMTDVRDKLTIDKAKQTYPVNFIAKPFQVHQLVIAIDLALKNEQSTPNQDASAFIKEGNEYFKVVYDDILFIKASSMYSEIYLSKGKKYVLTKSLNQLLKRLPNPDLIRIHRSHCINKNHVDKILGKTIFIGEHKFAIGKKYEEVLSKNFNLI